MKQKLEELEGTVDNSTIISRDLKTPLSIMGRTTEQRMNKEAEGAQGPSQNVKTATNHITHSSRECISLKCT